MEILHRKSIMKMKNRASAIHIVRTCDLHMNKNKNKNNPKNERKKEGKQKEEKTHSTQYVFCMIHTGMKKKIAREK